MSNKMIYSLLELFKRENMLYDLSSILWNRQSVVEDFFMWTSHSGKSSFLITIYDLYFISQYFILQFYVGCLSLHSGHSWQSFTGSWCWTFILLHQCYSHSKHVVPIKSHNYAKTQSQKQNVCKFLSISLSFSECCCVFELRINFIISKKYFVFQLHRFCLKSSETNYD